MYIPADPATANPWQDTRPSLPRRAQTVPLQHRLDFDDASGVMILPDDGDWLGDESDSEEDFVDSNGLENSTSDLTAEGVVSSPPGDMHATPSRHRYGTYYHHPERRKRT